MSANRPKNMTYSQVADWLIEEAVPVASPDYVKGDCWLCHLAPASNGYGVVGFGGKNHKAHRFVWEHEHGPIPDGMLVRHKCDTPRCIRPNHLELGTDADNNRDKVERDRQAKGERVGTAKLAVSEAARIRHLYATGNWTQKELAERFAVAESTIYYVVNEKTWKGET